VVVGLVFAALYGPSAWATVVASWAWCKRQPRRRGIESQKRKTMKVNSKMRADAIQKMRSWLFSQTHANQTAISVTSGS